MRYYLSEIMNTCKQERSFVKWIDALKIDTKNIAYDKRNVIDKRSIEDDLNCIGSLVFAYKNLKKLRKKSDKYDVIVFIDKKGYHNFTFKFPIADKDFDTAKQNYRDAVKKYGSSCVDFEEKLFKTLKSKIEKDFSFVEHKTYGIVDGYVEYSKYETSPHVGKIDARRFLNV